MGKEEFTEAIKKLNELIRERRIKAVIYPPIDSGFPEKRFTPAKRVFKNEITGVKEVKTVDVPLAITIVACKDDEKIHDLIASIINKEKVPYEIAILSAN